MNGDHDWLESMDRMLALPALLISSAFLPWVIFSGFFHLEVMGTDLVVGPVLILGGLAIAASWVYKSGKYRVDGWIAGGLFLEGATLWTLLKITQGLQTYKNTTVGQALGDTVSIDIGIGLILAAVVSAAIILAGIREYRASSEGFAVPEAVEALMHVN